MKYNSDFTELLSPLLKEIKWEFTTETSYIANMQYNNSNYKYIINLVYNGPLPLNFDIIVENDWTLKEYSTDKYFDNTIWDSPTISGGQVIFDPETIFTIKPYFKSSSNFPISNEDIKDLSVEDFKFQFTQSKESKRSFTKVNIKQIIKRINTIIEYNEQQINTIIQNYISDPQNFKKLYNYNSELVLSFVDSETLDLFFI